MRRWWAVWMMVCAFPLAAWGLELKSTGGGALTFQDEGTPVGSLRSVNCEGDGIACANVSGILTISVSGVGSSGLADPGGNGLVNRTSAGVTAPYAGATCTNQVLRVLSAAGAGTCATITSSFVDSSIALTGGHLGQFAATTSAQLAGVLSDESGASGVFVLTGAKLSVFAATTSAELAGVLSDEEGSSGGFVRAGGNVATATALAANGGNCSAGEAPLGVDTLGAVEDCFDVATQAELDTHTGSTTAHGATELMTAGRIVMRDGSGNFAANVITASLTGNASTATALASNPSPCNANEVVTDIAANGTLTCLKVKHVEAFTSQTSITVAGVTHGLATTDMLIQCWDGSSPRQLLPIVDATVETDDFEVVLTFSTSQTGRCVFLR